MALLHFTVGLSLLRGLPRYLHFGVGVGSYWSSSPPWIPDVLYTRTADVGAVVTARELSRHLAQRGLRTGNLRRILLPSSPLR